jgi:hypothetical protein
VVCVEKAEPTYLLLECSEGVLVVEDEAVWSRGGVGRPSDSTNIAHAWLGCTPRGGKNMSKAVSANRLSWALADVAGRVG